MVQRFFIKPTEEKLEINSKARTTKNLLNDKQKKAKTTIGNPVRVRERELFPCGGASVRVWCVLLRVSIRNYPLYFGTARSLRPRECFNQNLWLCIAGQAEQQPIENTYSFIYILHKVCEWGFPPKIFGVLRCAFVMPLEKQKKC